MVGVPGKSQGCLTCRRRKIRCDLAEPDCKNCSGTGRVCEGYARYPTFLINTPEGRQKRQRLEEAKPRSLDSGASSSTASRSSSASGPSQSNPMVAASSTALVVPRQVRSTNVNNVQIISAFWEKFVPKEIIAQEGGPCPWLHQIILKSDKSQALEVAVNALAMTRVGWAEGEAALSIRGRNQYGLALKRLQSALYDKDLMWHDDTLAAAYCLSTYEAFEATNNSIKGLNSHISGMGYLIKMRGPDSYQTPIARGVLHDYASSSMIQGLQFRAKNFLDDFEWRTRPWIHFEKDYHYRLIEHGIELGALIEELDSSGHKEGNLGLPGIVNYMARFSQLDHRLDEWFQEFQESAPSPLYTVTSPPSSPTAGGFDVTTFFNFPRLQLAVVTTHYWGIKIVLCSIVNAIALSLSRPNLAQGYSALDPGIRESMEQIIVEHDRERCVDLATKIIRTTPYCFADHMGLMAAQQSIFPMRAAMFLLERYPGDELDWCKALYSQFQERKGLKYATEIGKVAGRSLDQQIPLRGAGLKRKRIENAEEEEPTRSSPRISSEESQMMRNKSTGPELRHGGQGT